MERVVDFLEKLIIQSDQLIADLNRPSYDVSKSEKLQLIREISRWSRSSAHVLEYASLDTFRNQIGRITARGSFPCSHDVAEFTGVLETARDMLVNQFVGDVRYLVHAEFFDSLLGQAQELFETGHVSPSAVVGRIVLERWLRDQASKASIANEETEKAAILHDTLKKEKVFTVPKMASGSSMPGRWQCGRSW